MFEIVTPSTVEIVTVEHAKNQLAVSINQYDTLIESLITVAKTLVETEINGSITNTVKRFYTHCLSNPIRIPHGNVHTVTSVEYRTEDGNWNTLSTSLWDSDAINGQAIIFAKPNQFFP